MQKKPQKTKPKSLTISVYPFFSTVYQHHCRWIKKKIKQIMTQELEHIHFFFYNLHIFIASKNIHSSTKSIILNVFTFTKTDGYHQQMPFMPY